MSSQIFPTVGTELIYRYDLRSSVGLGCHFTAEKEIPAKPDGTCLSHMWMATYELRYFFSKKNLVGEDLSFKYFLYSGGDYPLKFSFEVEAFIWF